MFTLARDGFYRDFVVFFLVSLVIGALVVAGVSAAAGAYFGDTVSGYLGDFGEYDFIVHVREESAQAARAEMHKVLEGHLPGARIGKAVRMLGRVNFLVALSDDLRNADVMSSIPKYFGDIPGYEGYTLVIEPRITVSGVLPAAASILVPEIEKIPGVRFAFRTGSDLNIIADSVGDVGEVQKSVESLLKRYRILELRFPIGETVDNPAAMADEMAKAIRRELGAEFARGVSSAQATEDMDDFLNTLNEMKRFLSYYAASVEIQVTSGTKLSKGQRLALVPEDWQDDAAAAMVEITEVDGRTARGLVVEGAEWLFSGPRGDDAAAGAPARGEVVSEDSAFRDSGVAYTVDEDGNPKDRVGNATLKSDNRQLAHSIDESIKLLEELDSIVSEADKSTEEAMGILDVYAAAIDRVIEAQRAVETIEQAVVGASRSVDPEAVRKAVAVLRDAARSVDRLRETAGAVSFFADSIQGVLSRIDQVSAGLGDAYAGTDPQGSPGLGERLLALNAGLEALKARLASRAQRMDDFLNGLNPVVADLTRWRDSLDQYAAYLSNLSTLMEGGEEARGIIEGLKESTGSVLVRLQSLDVVGVRDSLQAIRDDLADIRAVDTGSIVEQLKYIRESLPRVEDGEVGRSISLIDRYIGGQVIPGERVQVMVDSKVPTDRARAVMRRIAGDGRLAVYASEVGIVQQTIRSEVIRVMQQARVTIAALVAVAFTLYTLAFDHTVLMSAMRRLAPARRRRRLLHVDPALVYGGLMGAAYMSILFWATGARMPLVDGSVVPVIGAVLGVLVGTQAEKLNPVKPGEILAGQALGLTNARILREIVIPEARPGILSLLNRRNQIFGGAARKARAARCWRFGVSARHTETR